MGSQENRSPIRIGDRITPWFAMWIAAAMLCGFGKQFEANKGAEIGSYYWPLFACVNFLILLAFARYYQILRRLQKEGETVNARVSIGQGGSIWIHYTHGEQNFDIKIGTIGEEKEFEKTLLDSLEKNTPVRIVVDPRSPSRHKILSAVQIHSPC